VKRLVSVLREQAKAKVSALNLILGFVGIQIIRKSDIVGFRPTLQRVKALGVGPATIFDIGVAYGTPDLYAEFRGAKFFLIDPVPDSLPYMRKWAKRLNASIHNIALGETDGELEIGVPDDIRGSTLYNQTEPSTSIEKISIPMRRFDSVFRPADLAAPCLVKLDVQGAELSVLRGMGVLLQNIELLIIEVSSIVTLDGHAAHMFDVIDYLRQNDFTIYDVCGLGRRPLDNALAQLDLVFCKKTSRLLQDRRWSAN
jgi:FkbM family methyltransferase